jgi:hypothetical protein
MVKDGAVLAVQPGVIYLSCFFRRKRGHQDKVLYLVGEECLHGWPTCNPGVTP